MLTPMCTKCQSVAWPLSALYWHNGDTQALFLKVRPLIVMGWKSLGRVSFWGKSDWKKKRFVCFRVFRTGKTYRRACGADRRLLVGEILLGVGISFVDKSHFDCGSVVTREEGIVGEDAKFEARMFMRLVDP